MTLEARNTGVAAAPFGAGCHPYFSIRDTPLDDVLIRVPASAYLAVDDAQIPVDTVDVTGTDYDLRTLRPLGALRLDTGFTGLSAPAGHRASAELVAGGHTTTMWWDAAFTALQVFTPPVLVDGATAIAIEPMTCPANAFNSGVGLLTLEPDQTWSAQWGAGIDQDLPAAGPGPTG